MPEEAPRRRLLVATGTTVGLVESATRLRESVARIAGLFQEVFGYERVTGLDLDPAREQMRQELRAVARACRGDDLVVLYHTGHADLVAGRHRLWMGDTDDPVTDTLATAEIAELMLAESPVRNLLIILDTCFAGQGGTEVLVDSLKAAGDFSSKSLLAITSAHPRQQVRAGDFARLFERSVNHPATAGYEPPYLSLPAIVSRINQDPERKAWQTVSYSTILGTYDAPFLPNPRYDKTFHSLDLATQLQIEQDEQRRQDIERFFHPRARGVDVPQEAGWNFVGRHAALRDLTAWLTDGRDSRSVVVTGDPGSGKSAVISRLVILSHRDWAIRFLGKGSRKTRSRYGTRSMWPSTPGTGQATKSSRPCARRHALQQRLLVNSSGCKRASRWWWRLTPSMKRSTLTGSCGPSSTRSSRADPTRACGCCWERARIFLTG
jgi:hypothetical protein